MPGVKIGKYSVIGAGSIVTKSIPDYSMAVGTPAKVIKKYNFDKHCWGGGIDFIAFILESVLCLFIYNYLLSKNHFF